ncbi:MAG: 4-hydroxy-tetrahydrodipicolinate reductase [Bacteroidetes bacterium]|nr:4-hydroxy-tetrahydrodipicolinate reductase [Bacteroidota bacterium]
MREKPRIALIGFGRMGRTLHDIISERDWPEPQIVDPQDDRMYESIDDLVGRDVQVCVEFTSPDQAVNNILACVRAGMPVVSGTTGWEDERSQVEKAVQDAEGACIHSNNFSIGVHIFRKTSATLAALLNNYPQYDLAIHEVHHVGKKDTPSGTALAMAEDVLLNNKNKKGIVRGVPEGMIDPTALYVTSERLGKVFGEHTVRIDSDSDEIELIHRAKGRRGFAEGALLAAQWICNKQGMFTLEDMLNDLA